MPTYTYPEPLVPDYTVEVIKPRPKDLPPSDGGYVPEPWPKLDNATLYELAGEVTTCLMPHTEADPAALLLTYLTYFGNAIGRGPYYLVEGTRHFANLFTLLAGATSKSRKGTSADRIRSIFELADLEWAAIERPQGGMSSGEGVIAAIRDPVFAMKKSKLEMVDPGVQDKRLLLYESEFSSVLAVLKREGNILSRVVRDAWDCRPLLQTMTKNSPTKATNPYISILAHITITELQRMLDETAMANGFANRFLLGCVRRARELPHGGNFRERDRVLLGRRTNEALNAARTRERVEMTLEARERWSIEYSALTACGDNLTDQITARGEAQVIRLALIYALLDQASAIAVEHLEPALALWRYCKASARHIFGEMTGDAIGDVILRRLRTQGVNGLSRQDITNLFGRNQPTNKIDASLGRLQDANKVFCQEIPSTRGFGRPKQMWFAK